MKSVLTSAQAMSEYDLSDLTTRKSFIVSAVLIIMNIYMRTALIDRVASRPGLDPTGLMGRVIAHVLNLAGEKPMPDAIKEVVAALEELREDVSGFPPESPDPLGSDLGTSQP